MASPPFPSTPAAWVPYHRFSELIFVSVLGHFAFAAVFGLWLAQPWLALSLGGSGLLVGALFPLLRSSQPARRVRLVAHAVLILDLLAVCVTLIWVGLRPNQSVWWVVWWPMFAAHLLGWRDGLAWVPLTLLAGLGLWLNHAQGWLEPLVTAQGLPLPVFAFQAGFLLIGCAVSLVVRRAYEGYQRDINHQQRTIQLQQQALAERAAHLEDMLQAVQQANLERTRLFAQISHEVRTPLNGVLGFAHLLGQTELSEQQARHLRQINQCGESLLQMVNEVLDFSRLESRTCQPERLVFDSARLAQDAMDMVLPAASQKGVTLHLEHDVQVAEVVGDPLRIKQVMLNLLANAVKFTDQGQVTLRCQGVSEPAGAWSLLIEVQDSGIGVPHSELPRLFEPFCVASDRTIQRYGGSGLGLAICKRLVDMMGGRIGVSSEPGQGSLFWFSVPVSLPVAAAGAATVAASREASPRAQHA